MTAADLDDLAADGESDHVEFKATTGQRTEAARTVCAFLNGTGGTLVFGIDDRRRVVGQTVTEKTVADVVRELRKVEPFVPISPEVVPLASGRAALAVSVPLGRDRPYAYDGRAYVRQGPTTSVMPRDRYDRLVKKNVRTRRAAGRCSRPTAPPSPTSTTPRSRGPSTRPSAGDGWTSPARAPRTTCSSVWS
jgi:ATP-dependent DNA helicase RecG